jgi:hypothetical protein
MSRRIAVFDTTLREIVEVLVRYCVTPDRPARPGFAGIW